VFSASSAGVVLTWIGPVPPITLAAWRLQLTGVIAALCAVPQWYQLPAEQRRQFFKDVGWSVFSGSCLALHFGAWVWSLQHTSLAHSVLLVCTAPVILVAAAVLMRQPISPGEIAAAVLAVAGGGQLLAVAAAVVCLTPGDHSCSLLLLTCHHQQMNGQ
jgi:drug/metabolite transporter (DMT)-like permease